jgi:hypothetical protein
MSTPATVNEGSSASLVVSFFNADGDPDAPSSVTYRIYDHASGEEIRPDTVVAGFAITTIPLTPDDTVIVNPARSQEQRRVTVVATYGADDQLTDEYSFFVKNLRNYP